MAPKFRILVAGLYHETNTFVPGEAEDFLIRRGDELLAIRGDASPLGAILAEAPLWNCELLVAVDGRAKPGPPVPESELQRFFSIFEEEACRVGHFDAIFLVLHGAMATRLDPDVEGTFLRRIRQLPALSRLPIYGVLDLHANFTAPMALYSTALLSYRENPHTDAASTALRAFKLMRETLESKRSLSTYQQHARLLWPPAGTATAAEPMKNLEAIAREEECRGIVAVNVFAGFAHADVPDAGVSFSVVFDPHVATQEQVEACCKRLTDCATSLHEHAFPDEWDIDEAILDAEAKGCFPACLVEASDNIGGGGPGDGTAVLRALLRHRAKSSGVVLCDPESIAALDCMAIGALCKLEIGGRRHPDDSGPLRIQGRILHRSNGRFKLEDPYSHAASSSGLNISMGPSVLLDVEDIFVLLTSRRTAPSDLGQWRSQGVDPEKFRFIGIKAAVAYRRAYEAIAIAHYPIRIPGPCSSDLRSLNYKNIRRPIAPLDPIEITTSGTTSGFPHQSLETQKS